jgi:DNA-binding GntR family transcriptional regulator
MLEKPTLRPSEAATKHFWDLIRTKQLMPGDRINESRIAKQLGVSQGAVREALQRLAEQGIVEVIPFKGGRLIALTPDDFDQIIEIRQLLEPHALRLARDKVTEDDLKDLRALIEHMGSAPNVHAFDEYHFLFHQRLWEISRNRQLVRILRHLTTSLFAFYEVLRTLGGRPPDHRGATHQRLIEAVHGKEDPEQVIREHLNELRTDEKLKFKPL